MNKIKCNNCKKELTKADYIFKTRSLGISELTLCKTCKTKPMNNYALYNNNGDYTLILEDNSVYSFDEHENVFKVDGELNAFAEYTHLGYPATIDDINNIYVKEHVLQLIMIQ